MPLSSPTLQTQLLNVLNTEQENVDDAISQLAAAINSYLSSGAFGSSTATWPPTSTLEATIKTGTYANLSTFISSLESGLKTYLTGLVIAGSSGAGTSIAPTGTLASLNNSLDPENELSKSQAAQELATAIDTMAKTTSASLTISPNPPVIFLLT